MDASAFAELLDLARRREHDSVTRLFNLYQADLSRAAERLIPIAMRTKCDSQDILQDTFLRAWECFDQFQGTTQDELNVWMQRLLTSQLTNAIRRFYSTKARDIRREKPLFADVPSSQAIKEPIAPHTSPSQHAVRAEIVLQFNQALAALPEHYRLVLDWHERQGVPLHQIARHLGRSEEAVRKLWSRALLALHRAVHELH